MNDRCKNPKGKKHIENKFIFDHGIGKVSLQKPVVKVVRFYKQYLLYIAKKKKKYRKIYRRKLNPHKIVLLRENSHSLNT